MYEQGKRDHAAYLESKIYASFPRDLNARDGMRIFLPCIIQPQLMMATPLPKERLEWMRGWND